MENLYPTRCEMEGDGFWRTLTDHSDIFDGIWLCCFKQRLYTTDIFVFLYAVGKKNRDQLRYAGKEQIRFQGFAVLRFPTGKPETLFKRKFPEFR